MKGVLIFVLAFVLVISFSGNVSAADYYVSSTGTAAWSSCTNINTPCSLATANPNAQAGDTIYLRGGTYTSSTTVLIEPARSGTGPNSKIIYEAYAGEIPILEGDGYDTNQYGIHLDNKDWIVVRGITFKNQARSCHIMDGSDYNEIDNCTFYHTTQPQTPQYGTILILINDKYGNGQPSTHNWFHNNIVHHGSALDACGEGGDLLKIDGTNCAGDSNYNTIEDNIFYSVGHAIWENFGRYNVFKGNVVHNEGWKPNGGCVYGTSTGGSTTTLVDTGKDFGALGVQSGWYAFVISAQSTKRGDISSVSSSTITFNLNPTAFGSPTYSNGVQYVVCPCGIAPNPVGSNPGNGLYGHRGVSFTGYNQQARQYCLAEDNRIGYGSSNPGNNGADGFTLGSPGNIIRYNNIYGCDGPGINLKAYIYGETSAGAYNTIYSNTIYKNGRTIVSNSNPADGVAIKQYNPTYSINNEIRNNLFRNNGDPSFSFKYGDYTGDTADQIWGNNICDATNANIACTQGSPTFTNPDMSDMTSLVLPDLSLQEGSVGIDDGTYLTQANGLGSNSLNLIVDNALFFQDGSWGSALSNIQADWIAIGTVDNFVQISSINYVTNAITLSSPKTWINGDSVWLYKDSSGRQVLYGSAPDIGAYEYISGSTSSCGLADTSGNSIIEIGELINYISQWKLGNVVIGELITAIGEWKNGC